MLCGYRLVISPILVLLPEEDRLPVADMFEVMLECGVHDRRRPSLLFKRRYNFDQWRNCMRSSVPGPRLFRRKSTFDSLTVEIELIGQGEGKQHGDDRRRQLQPASVSRHQ